MAVSVAATQTILPGDGAHDDETPTDHAAKSHRVGEQLAEMHIELPTLPSRSLLMRRRHFLEAWEEQVRDVTRDAGGVQ